MEAIVTNVAERVEVFIAKVIREIGGSWIFAGSSVFQGIVLDAVQALGLVQDMQTIIQRS